MIVIVTYEDYPDGSPGAIRCASFAQAYINLGYDVVVFHKGEYSSDNNPKIISLYNKNKYKKYFGFSHSVVQQLEILKKSNEIEAVIFYSTVFKHVYKWCKRNDVPYICDVVEWYSKEQFSGKWYLSTAYWRKEWDIRFLAQKRFNVIGISSYLTNYFTAHGCKSVCIPIISKNIETYQDKTEDMSKVNIIYAGSHLLMDNIPLIIKSLSLLCEEERKRICLTIYGLSKEMIYSHLSDEEIKKTEEVLNIKGRCPNKEVIEAYKTSHFTILLRNPKLRVNMAGFPSKAVESMRMGVPVLGNYSSDLDKYLVNGENAIIVEELSEKALVSAFKSILKLSSEQMVSLRKNVIETVNTKLSPEAFKSEFIEIISK